MEEWTQCSLDTKLMKWLSLEKYSFHWLVYNSRHGWFQYITLCTKFLFLDPVRQIDPKK